MAKSISAFKVTLILWISLSSIVQSATIRGQLSDMAVVTNIISYVKPYIQSLQLGPDTVYKRVRHATSPEMAIDEKIKELQPYFQDNDALEKVELEGDDETTIIEFTPRAHDDIKNTTKESNEMESLKANLRKYKKMRHKIKLALERESVSNSTKHIVTTTLDELIATLVQRQCPEGALQNDLNKLARFRSNFLKDFIPKITYDSDNNCYIKGKKLTDAGCKTLKNPYEHCELYGKKISEEECKKILHFAMSDKPCYIGNKKYSSGICKGLAKNITDSINMSPESFKEYIKTLLPSTDNNIVDFYNSFTQTVTNVLRESNKLPDKYRVKCTLVDIEKNKMKKSLRNKDACQDFRICSEELREFLTIFYKSLNETAVRAFHNYAAMYDRDIVADDSDEKNAVIDVINHASDALVDRVSNVFIKTTGQIALDENKDKDMNIAALREFVKHTVKSVNKTVSKHLEYDLSVLKARLLLAIKADLAHNLASDLGHLETDVVKQICSFFITCKGNLPKVVPTSHDSFRKRSDVKHKNNNIFMQLELALDDDLKDILLKNKEAVIKNHRLNNMVAMRNQYDINNTILVTRTTEPNEDLPSTVHISVENSESDKNNEGLQSLTMVRK